MPNGMKEYLFICVVGVIMITINMLLPKKVSESSKMGRFVFSKHALPLFIIAVVGFIVIYFNIFHLGDKLHESFNKKSSKTAVHKVVKKQENKSSKQIR
jgi:hypothetical protein